VSLCYHGLVILRLVLRNEQGDLPISLSVYRVTVSAAFRNSGATQTSTGPGAVDETAQSSGVISDQESSKKDSPAEHLPQGKQTTGVVTPEERQLVPATSPDGLKDPGTVTLKRREPLRVASSERGKAGAGEGTAVGPLENSRKEKPAIAQQSLTIGSPVDHLLRDGRPVVAVNVGPKQSLLTMSSNRGETVVNGRTAVNTPRDTIGQEMPRYELSYNSTITVATSNLILCSRLRLTVRPPPRVAYPETIDVELPDSFLNEGGNDEGMSKGNDQQFYSLWRTEVVAPLPAGWNPNLLYVCLATYRASCKGCEFAYSD